MSLTQNSLDSLPDGEVVDSSPMPVLNQAHTSRLRKLWSFGRPMTVGELTGTDLDLAVHGLVETVSRAHSGYAALTVTKRGVAYLSEKRQLLIVAQRPHHELGARLAQHLQHKGFHTWENVEFANPSWTEPRHWAIVRPDVFACIPCLKAANAAPAIYEVKVSRADFLADLSNPVKRQAYADLAEAVYYCCPVGLINKAEIPDGFGLLVETEPGVFELMKKARRRKNFVMTVDTAMTLMVKRQIAVGQDAP